MDYPPKWKCIFHLNGYLLSPEMKQGTNVAHNVTGRFLIDLTIVAIA